MKSLIIVESPTKAKTFGKILKSEDTVVFATMGHIRDLPKSKLSIDVEKDFKPTYINLKDKNKIITELKKLAKNSDTIYLATDSDREGESISYHIAYILGFIKENWPEFKLIQKKGKDLKRIVFHEITKEALEEAIKKPITLRAHLVKAQQARRILDRIVGYELSPLLWKKMGKYWLSAGRVQTVALRFIVEREKERNKFKQEEYKQIFGVFGENLKIKAQLKQIGDKQVSETVKLKLFAGDYSYTRTIINNKNIKKILSEIKEDSYKVLDVAETITKKQPAPPFTTSMMQQEAFSKLGLSSRATMRLAQNLYEAGLITYHRTDSFYLSPKFISQARNFISKRFSKDHVPQTPNFFKNKSKNAQEAHEAIRPTKLTPTIEPQGRTITKRHVKLYELIFKRAVASQMSPAKIKNIRIKILGNKYKYLFSSSFQKVLFGGFLDLINPDFVKKTSAIPQVKKDSNIKLIEIETEDKKTMPPPRYNDASLIKVLEKSGIGRPSTYAPIIYLLQQKKYVEKSEKKQFVPTVLGIKISDYLSSAFPDILNIGFTAKMEDGLDKIAKDKETISNILSPFYKTFKKDVEKRKNDKTKIQVEEKTDEKCPKCGAPLVIKFSRFGKFYACTNFPKCKFTKPFITYVKDVVCPKCGGRIVVRRTRKGKRFYGCENYPKCDFSSWKLNTINKKGEKKS